MQGYAGVDSHNEQITDRGPLAAPSRQIGACYLALSDVVTLYEYVNVCVRP